MANKRMRRRTCQLILSKIKVSLSARARARRGCECEHETLPSSAVVGPRSGLEASDGVLFSPGEALET